ncbi:TetR/AcrR family transcriptional regulator [Mycobacterium sp. Y57]|uniref:TetR/AcrR family transcriptional regulator n=1 Tax=Mycolicibacterium xanthum TaxID=2796469 RepID=UPI001C854EE9|nr:TetR/AcrR family transcriptional regulator [Mycolicibacterium xanthum]MBX7435095.1 TetR/AcrR family transcriptional regulator [Mycolicibacterium xanthum]
MNSNEKPRRLTRVEARAQTRQRLLDAAAEVFARKGYGAASVDEIAEAAGFSVGAVYSNFAGKEQLFSELMAERAVGRIEAIVGAMQAAREQGGDPLGLLGRMLIEAADQDIEAAALQTEFWLHAVRNPDTMAILAAGTGRTLTLLRDVVAGLLADKDVDSSVTPESFAVVVLALYQGLVRQRRTDPERVPEELFGQALSWQIAGMPKVAGKLNRK